MLDSISVPLEFHLFEWYVPTEGATAVIGGGLSVFDERVQYFSNQNSSRP